MKASKFVTELARISPGASLVLVDGKVRLSNGAKVPRYLKVAIVRHRPHLQAFLAEGVDVELDRQPYSVDELTTLGFAEFLQEEIHHADGSITQRWGWGYGGEGGDEVGDQILTGLLDAGEIKEQRRQAEQASKDAVWSKAHPAKWGRRIPGL